MPDKRDNDQKPQNVSEPATAGVSPQTREQLTKRGGEALAKLRTALQTQGADLGAWDKQIGDPQHFFRTRTQSIALEGQLAVIVEYFDSLPRQPEFKTMLQSLQENPAKALGVRGTFAAGMYLQATEYHPLGREEGARAFWRDNPRTVTADIRLPEDSPSTSAGLAPAKAGVVSAIMQEIDKRGGMFAPRDQTGAAKTVMLFSERPEELQGLQAALESRGVTPQLNKAGNMLTVDAAQLQQKLGVSADRLPASLQAAREAANARNDTSVQRASASPPAEAWALKALQEKAGNRAAADDALISGDRFSRIANASGWEASTDQQQVRIRAAKLRPDDVSALRNAGASQINIESHAYLVLNNINGEREGALFRQLINGVKDFDDPYARPVSDSRGKAQTRQRAANAGWFTTDGTPAYGPTPGTGEGVPYEASEEYESLSNRANGWKQFKLEGKTRNPYQGRRLTELGTLESPTAVISGLPPLSIAASPPAVTKGGGNPEMAAVNLPPGQQPNRQTWIEEPRSKDGQKVARLAVTPEEVANGKINQIIETLQAKGINAEHRYKHGGGDFLFFVEVQPESMAAFREMQNAQAAAPVKQDAFILKPDEQSQELRDAIAKARAEKSPPPSARRSAKIDLDKAHLTGPGGDRSATARLSVGGFDSDQLPMTPQERADATRLAREDAARRTARSPGAGKSPPAITDPAVTPGSPALYWPTKELPPPPPHFKPEFMNLDGNNVARSLDMKIGWKAANDIAQYVYDYAVKPVHVARRAAQQYAAQHGIPETPEAIDAFRAAMAKVNDQYDNLLALHKKMLASDYRSSGTAGRGDLGGNRPMTAAAAEVVTSGKAPVAGTGTGSRAPEPAGRGLVAGTQPASTPPVTEKEAAPVQQKSGFNVGLNAAVAGKGGVTLAEGLSEGDGKKIAMGGAETTLGVAGVAADLKGAAKASRALGTVGIAIGVVGDGIEVYDVYQEKGAMAAAEKGVGAAGDTVANIASLGMAGRAFSVSMEQSKQRTAEVQALLARAASGEMNGEELVTRLKDFGMNEVSRHIEVLKATTPGTIVVNSIQIGKEVSYILQIASDESQRFNATIPDIGPEAKPEFHQYPHLNGMRRQLEAQGYFDADKRDDPAAIRAAIVAKKDSYDGRFIGISEKADLKIMKSALIELDAYEGAVQANKDLIRRQEERAEAAAKREAKEKLLAFGELQSKADFLSILKESGAKVPDNTSLPPVVAVVAGRSVEDRMRSVDLHLRSTGASLPKVSSMDEWVQTRGALLHIDPALLPANKAKTGQLAPGQATPAPEDAPVHPLRADEARKPPLVLERPSEKPAAAKPSGDAASPDTPRPLSQLSDAELNGIDAALKGALVTKSKFVAVVVNRDSKTADVPQGSGGRSLV